MVVQIKSGKRENGKSFWCNLYRKRSNKEEEEEEVQPTGASGLQKRSPHDCTSLSHLSHNRSVHFFVNIRAFCPLFKSIYGPSVHFDGEYTALLSLFLSIYGAYSTRGETKEPQDLNDVTIHHVQPTGARTIASR